MVINYYYPAVQGSVDVMSPVSLGKSGGGGVRGGADSGWGGLLLGHRRMQMPTLRQIPAEARFGGGRGERGHFPRKQASKDPKPSGSWSPLPGFPRSLFPKPVTGA